jgi:hypothetical protein
MRRRTVHAPAPDRRAAQARLAQLGWLTPARRLPDGTPHPDPRLASRGWQVRGRVYVRGGRSR